MSESQEFGGNWVVEKLNIFSDYLNFYITALKNQRFGKIYIDAFAGTGQIINRNWSKMGSITNSGQGPQRPEIIRGAVPNLN